MAVTQVAVEISVLVEDEARQGPARRIPASPGLEAAFLSACTSAASPAVCTANPGTGSSSLALAVVEWRGTEQVRLEVAGPAAGSPRWVRQLEFLPGDAPEERWKAAGYTAGTLARELLGAAGADERSPAVDAPASAPASTESGAAAEPDAVPKAREPEADVPEQKPAAPARDTPEAARSLWLDAGGWGGRGLWRSTLRLGGFARFTRIFDGPLVTASIAYTTDGPDGQGLSGTWLTPSVGGGYGLRLARRLTASVRCEIVAERLALTARDSTTRRTDEASRWVGGARVGTDLAFIAIGPLGLVLGGDVTLRATETHVELENEVIGSLPAWDWAFQLGLRAALP